MEVYRGRYRRNQLITRRENGSPLDTDTYFIDERDTRGAVCTQVMYSLVDENDTLRK